jgi:hypothetical protein
MLESGASGLLLPLAAATNFEWREKKEHRGAGGKGVRNLGAKSRGPHDIKLAVVRAYNAAKLGDLAWEQELRPSFHEGTTPSSLGRGRGISAKSPAYSRLIDGRITCPKILDLVVTEVLRDDWARSTSMTPHNLICRRRDVALRPGRRQSRRRR